jgi:inhibitor of KinA sporulation pathway (predicted exonuclease)
MANMAKRLDHVIVIDIESTCWDGGFPPRGETNDIIEIGLCSLEISSGRRLEKRSILVRPERSKVSKFCTELTTLTQEQVEGGIAFKDACKILEHEYLSQERLWASFGDYDRRQFEKQCRDQGVRYPFGPSHLNVKTLFAVSRGLPSEVGLPQAMALLGLKLEGTHHRGHDDAWNIAVALWETIKKINGPRQG